MDPDLTEILEAARALESDPVMARARRLRARQNAREALSNLVRTRLALKAIDQAIEAEFAEMIERSPGLH